MFCHQCKYECAEGTKTCPNCGTSLSDAASNDERQDTEQEYIELVTVMETSDRALIAFVKSILEDAGIKYFVNGESLLNLGRAAIDAKIQVDKRDAQAALELLKDLN